MTTTTSSGSNFGPKQTIVMVMLFLFLVLISIFTSSLGFPGGRLKQPSNLIAGIPFLGIAIVSLGLTAVTVLTVRSNMKLSRKRRWLNRLASAYAWTGVLVFFGAWFLYVKGSVIGLPISDVGMVVLNAFSVICIFVRWGLRRIAASLDLDLSRARFTRGNTRS